MDTKEEQNRTMEWIIYKTAANLALEEKIDIDVEIGDYKSIRKFSYSFKEELVRRLIKYEFITNNKIADKCGLSVREVAEIKSKT